MAQKLAFESTYAAPTTRVIQVSPARCIAGSDRMSDMNKNSLYEEECE